MSNSLYHRDPYAWANEQARLLRARKLSDADIEHIAEEIESMGRSETRELINRLIVLLHHLLKGQFQPERHGSSWEATITVQRHALERHLDDNPSLQGVLPLAIGQAYRDAVIEAAGETGMLRQTFPAVCPWTFDQIMDEDFWPGADSQPDAYGCTVREPHHHAIARRPPALTIQQPADATTSPPSARADSASPVKLQASSAVVPGTR